jgi:hypothetical protein
MTMKEEQEGMLPAMKVNEKLQNNYDTNEEIFDAAAVYKLFGKKIRGGHWSSFYLCTNDFYTIIQ